MRADTTGGPSVFREGALVVAPIATQLPGRCTTCNSSADARVVPRVSILKTSLCGAHRFRWRLTTIMATVLLPLGVLLGISGALLDSWTTIAVGVLWLVAGGASALFVPRGPSVVGVNAGLVYLGGVGVAFLASLPDASGARVPPDDGPDPEAQSRLAVREGWGILTGWRIALLAGAVLVAFGAAYLTQRYGQ